MSRYRLLPMASQEMALRDHCAHARFVWNLAVEQQLWWRPGRKKAPGYLDQCRQLTEARAEHDWLRAGSHMVQQQALRDFSQAMASFFSGTHRKPTWRKAGRNEGFRVVVVKPGQVRRLSRHVGELWIPKDKAPGRVEKVSPAYTSQRCSACGHVAAESRKSQAHFACVACSFACNADVNAARNIAAGHAVTARGGDGAARPVNREPQLLLLPA